MKPKQNNDSEQKSLLNKNGRPNSGIDQNQPIRINEQINIQGNQDQKQNSVSPRNNEMKKAKTGLSPDEKKQMNTAVFQLTQKVILAPQKKNKVVPKGSLGKQSKITKQVTRSLNNNLFDQAFIESTPDFPNNLKELQDDEDESKQVYNFFNQFWQKEKQHIYDSSTEHKWGLIAIWLKRIFGKKNKKTMTSNLCECKKLSNFEKVNLKSKRGHISFDFGNLFIISSLLLITLILGIQMGGYLGYIGGLGVLVCVTLFLIMVRTKARVILLSVFGGITLICGVILAFAGSSNFGKTMTLVTLGSLGVTMFLSILWLFIKVVQQVVSEFTTKFIITLHLWLFYLIFQALVVVETTVSEYTSIRFLTDGLIAIDILLISLFFSIKSFKISNSNQKSEIFLLLNGVSERYLGEISFSPESKKSRHFLEGFVALVSLIIPIFQAVAGTYIADSFIYETNYDLFKTSPPDFKARRLVSAIFFFFPTIVLMLSTIGRMKYHNYWKYLIVLGSVSAVFLSVMNFAKYADWTLEASQKVFNYSSDEQFYPTATCFFIGGLIMFSQGSKRFFAMFLILLSHSLTTIPIFVWVLTNYDHGKESIARYISGSISFGLLIVFIIKVIISNCKNKKKAKQNWFRIDKRPFAQLFNYFIFLSGVFALSIYAGIGSHSALFIFSLNEKGNFVSSGIHLFEVFIILGFAIQVVYEENLTNQIYKNNHFFKFMAQYSKHSDEKQKLVRTSQRHRVLLFIFTFAVFPIISIFFSGYLTSRKDETSQIIGGSGKSLIVLSIFLGFFIIFYFKMISLMKMNYLKYGYLLIMLYWTIIPISYSVGFVSYSSKISGTGGSAKCYFVALMFYFSATLLLVTTIVPYILNIYIFKIEREKSIKRVAKKLRLQVAYYYVYANNDILSSWVNYFFLNNSKNKKTQEKEPQNPSEEKKIEPKNQSILKRQLTQKINQKESVITPEMMQKIREGMPVFWWAYGGEKGNIYKKELVSHDKYNKMMEDIDIQLGMVNKGCCVCWPKMLRCKGKCQCACCLEGIPLENIERKGEIEKGATKEYLAKQKQLELNAPFKETVALQDQRRLKVYNKISKLVHQDNRHIGVENYKKKLNKDKYFSMKKTDYRDLPEFTELRKFGKEFTKNPYTMTEAYFTVRAHPYFTILKKNETERNFFLYSLYQNFSSPSSLTDKTMKPSMSYYDFMQMAQKIGLINHIYANKKKDDISYTEDEFKKNFLENCYEKRIFVSKNFQIGSVKEMVKKAFTAEVGLDFDGFKEILGLLSSIRYFKTKEEYSEPSAKYTCFLYELCIVNLTDFRNLIFSHPFYHDLKLKSHSDKEQTKLDKIKFNFVYNQIYAKRFKLSKYSYERNTDLIDALIPDKQGIEDVLATEESDGSESEIDPENSEEEENNDKGPQKIQTNEYAKEVNHDPSPSVNIGGNEGNHLSEHQTKPKIRSKKKKKKKRRRKKKKLSKKDEERRMKEQEVKNIEKNKNKKKKPGCLDKTMKCFSKIGDWITWAKDKTIGCLINCCKKKFRQLGFISDDDLFEQNEKNIMENNEEPSDWEQFSLKLLTHTEKFKETVTEDFEQTSMRINEKNIIKLITSVGIVIWGHASMFLSNNWYNNANIENDLNLDDSKLAFYEKWWLSFITVVIITIVNFSLVFYSYKKIQNGTLGINPENGQPSKAGGSQWIIANLILLFSDSAFSFVISAYSRLLACDFNGDDPLKWKPLISPSSDLVCYTGSHMMFTAVSGILFVLYYMSSTTLYPNFQLNDPDLDIKFKPNYIIIKTQGAVVVVLLEILLKSLITKYSSTIIIFATKGIFSLILFLLTAKFKSCITESYNKVQATFHLLEFIPTLTLVVLLFLKNSTVALIVYISLTVITIIALIIGWIMISKKKKKLDKENQKNTEVINEMKQSKFGNPAEREETGEEEMVLNDSNEVERSENKTIDDLPNNNDQPNLDGLFQKANTFEDEKHNFDAENSSDTQKLDKLEKSHDKVEQERVQPIPNKVPEDKSLKQTESPLKNISMTESRNFE